VCRNLNDSPLAAVEESPVFAGVVSLAEGAGIASTEGAEDGGSAAWAAGPEGTLGGGGRAASPCGGSLEVNPQIVETPCSPPNESGGREEYFQACSTRCGSPWCPTCCAFYGWKIRERLEAALAGCGPLLMLTFTVDPSAGDARELLDWARERRAVAEVVKQLYRRGHLRSKRFFAVLEFQQNGYPHWHVLVESKFVPHEVVSHLWNLNRPAAAGPAEPGRPGFGFVWVSKCDFKDGVHAARYATKYLIKAPRHGHPKWIEQMSHLHRHYVSHGFWSGVVPLGDLQGDQAKSDPVSGHPASCFCEVCRGEAPAEEREKGKPVTMAERWAKCGKGTDLFAVDEETGSDGKTVRLQKRWLARIREPLTEVAATLDMLCTGRKVRLRRIDVMNLRSIYLRLNSVRWSNWYGVAPWCTGKRRDEAGTPYFPAETEFSGDLRPNIRNISGHSSTDVFNIEGASLVVGSEAPAESF
jgi:hypothetical protein